MNKENLINLKQLLLDQINLNELLSHKKASFDSENEQLLTRIRETNEGIELCKGIARENAEAGFIKDGIKKRLGGIGIRVSTKLVYDENNALIWAKDNMPVAIKTILDKKLFDKFAKDNTLNFVEKNDIIIVTFPKEIIINEVG